MSREIKFRAWCNRTKKFVQDDTYGLLLNGTHIARSQYNEVGAQMAYTENSALDLSFMQFTGLHDKHGKEIWEGDIVRCAGSTPREIQEVVFKEGSFATYIDDGMWIEMSQNSFDFEVIGNIYENSELLNNPKD